MKDYRVDLEIFCGPMDLLLDLVRKCEVDIREIPIARITEQYLGYLELLEMINMDLVGDFLVMASTLMEIKSRTLLPQATQPEEESEDPRNELVRQLLEYKKFKDAASMLEERSRAWQQHYPRLAAHRPTHPSDPASEPVQEAELWDLVSAVGRMMRETLAAAPESILLDETPIQVYMNQIERQATRSGRIAFSALFEGRIERSRIVGIFLALLELIRNQSVHAEQDQDFGEIWIRAASAGRAASTAESMPQPNASPSGGLLEGSS